MFIITFSLKHFVQAQDQKGISIVNLVFCFQSLRLIKTIPSSDLVRIHHFGLWLVT